MSTNIPPSPIPPWHRPVQSPLTETLTEDNDAGQIGLERDTTYLRTDVLKEDPTEPYAVTIPDGNYKRQIKRIYIPSDVIQTTAPWIISGTFASGGTSIRMNSIATAAVLEWDGAGWQLIGGNAVTDETIVT